MNISAIDTEATCEKLRRLCKSQGYTVSDIQRVLQLGSSQAVYKWFSGKNIPNLDNLVTLSDYLGVSLDEIIVRKDVEIR